MKVLKYGGRGVDVVLISQREPGPSTVFWSPKTETQNGFNSFVIVADENGPWATEDGTRVALISVNGIGEIRWTVSSREYDHRNAEGSIEHFRLKPVSP